ncbi:MAG: hypothetical protein RL641_596 [Candidatus Parcubacteria bacterium]
MASFNFDYFFGKIYDFFNWLGSSLFGVSLPHFFILLASALTAVFIFIIFYSSIRIREIDIEERKKKEEKLSAQLPVTAPKHEKWELIQGHMFSNNPAEWRLAIIEADTILEELTIKLGLRGDTLGDRLKSAVPADFNNVQTAWEAHKVRNRIAHDGSSYEITQAEANRVIRMYEDVFNEFNYI